MNLKKLHEGFIAQARRPMTFGALPVSPKEAEAPIMAVERWREAGGALHKTYRFRRLSDRTAFVMQLLAYEESVEHNAEIHVSYDRISLKLQTHDVGKPTELDREYARYADVLFKDLAYRPGVESWHGTQIGPFQDFDE